MKRPALYSSRRRSAAEPTPAGVAAPRSSQVSAPNTAPPTAGARLRALCQRHQSLLAFAAAVTCAVAISVSIWMLQDGPRELTQEDIDAAVLHTLENKTLQSRAAKAAESVRQVVVMVRGFADDPPGEGEPAAKGEAPKDRNGGATAKGKGNSEPADGEKELNVGSGVVIVDEGLILTNLHVVAGAKRLKVTFYNGLESEAELVGAHPANDLAVIRAKTLPDDLPAAMIGSTHRLKPGDEVVAVGFPFGIGPSVSAGVISGLNREFLSPKGHRLLTRLIQFDAAVNPGNSGGPLVTMDGEVVGIVVALLNPSESRTFIGIGFATTIEAAGGAVGIPPF